MRVSNAVTEHCNEALFTVVASGPQVGSNPSVVQTYTVAMNQFSALFKRLGATCHDSEQSLIAVLCRCIGHPH